MSQIHTSSCSCKRFWTSICNRKASVIPIPLFQFKMKNAFNMMLLKGDNSLLEMAASHSFITTKIQIITKYGTQNLWKPPKCKSRCSNNLSMMQFSKPKKQINIPYKIIRNPRQSLEITHVFKLRDDISSIGVNFFSDDPASKESLFQLDMQWNP